MNLIGGRNVWVSCSSCFILLNIRCLRVLGVLASRIPNDHSQVNRVGLLPNLGAGAAAPAATRPRRARDGQTGRIQDTQQIALIGRIRDTQQIAFVSARRQQVPIP